MLFAKYRLHSGDKILYRFATSLLEGEVEEMTHQGHIKLKEPDLHLGSWIEADCIVAKIKRKVWRRD